MHIELTRTDKMNAFDVTMLHQLADAYTQLEDDADLRVGLLFSQGDHFTSGLDLGSVAKAIETGEPLFPENLVDPLQLFGRPRTKPVVMAVQGYCLTIGIELILANDICVASPGTKFGQIEIKRGILPFGGATLRFTQRCGWGNAMRYLLTGDIFEAEEALRIGLVQEIAEDSYEASLAIAETIARQAPLGVQQSLSNARSGMEGDFQAAIAELMPAINQLIKTDDAREGVRSFVERREANFKGR